VTSIRPELEPLRIGIVTVSDRAAAGTYDDLSGAESRACLTQWIASPWEETSRCIPDDRPLVEATLVELTDWRECRLVISTGGTGPALRDVTPDATEAVCDRLLPGFGMVWAIYELSALLVSLMVGAPLGAAGLPGWSFGVAGAAMVLCLLLHIGGLRGATALAKDGPTA
jgi:molybdenum cofactor synthesis domain-containing protein